MASNQVISSCANALVKDIRRAASRGALTSEGYWVAESFHLLDEALQSRLELKVVLASRSVLSEVRRCLTEHPAVPVRPVEETVFDRIASTETSQGVISLVRPPGWKLDDVFQGAPLLVVLDGLQDPGNAGAIVRSAEAFGASGVLLLKGTVSAANTKVLRASAGSLFRVPFLERIDREVLRDEMDRRGVRAWAASSRGGRLLQECNFRDPSAVVIGSEAHGVSPALRNAVEELSIPTRGVESLNASAAAAVILYEASRQRT